MDGLGYFGKRLGRYTPVPKHQYQDFPDLIILGLATGVNKDCAMRLFSN
jgi:hypothetical protein